MVTFNQLLKKKSRIKKKRTNRKSALMGKPMARGACLKVYRVSPKKPNSAERRVAKIKISTKRSVIAHIPGIGHNLMKYSSVMVRAGRTQDLIGVKYKVMRGKFDLLEEKIPRIRRRSKYGLKKIRE
jgi:small subunit ribosomal protein S12